MDTERNILFVFWVVCSAAVYFLVPRAKAHEFLFCFFSCQAVGWMLELLLVQYHLVAYPIREFPAASDLNITAKLMWTPVVSGLSYIYRPRVNRMARVIYAAAWISLLTLVDGLLAAYTDLVEYVHFHWSLMALVFTVLLLSVNFSAAWFFRGRKVFVKEAGDP